jgi:hypothetical protein
MCGFMDLQDLATAGHTAMLLLYEYQYIKIQWLHSLLLFHVVPGSSSLPCSPTLETYFPFAIMSPWQHVNNVKSVAP